MIVSAPFYKGPARWNMLRQDWPQWASHIFLGRERDHVRELDLQAAKDIAKFYFGQEDVSKLESTQETLDTLTKV